MKFFQNLVWVAIFSLSGTVAAQTPVYLDETKPMEDRIEDALSRMTLEEKVALCHAQSKFSSPGVPRLGLPENWMTDGPHGVRAEVIWDEWDQAGWTNDSCMAFPALTCLAATWNPEMALLYGKSIGEEARYRNKNVLLGPGVNIYRTPLNGRNFEYMGEDPYLASEMVVPYIEGVQSNGVAACVKHYALNNQEYDRHAVNVEVSDRALYEIYLPAFKAAVQKGKAWAIMGAYNRYKNQYCCHNQYLLNDILRKECEKKDVHANILVEVNVAGEDSKFGIKPEETESLIRQIAKLPRVHVRGLMTIAPFVEKPEENRPIFHKLHKLLVDISAKNIDNIDMNVLSMGMTNDYEIAVEEGATHVRVGTGIFGERNYAV